MLTPYPFEIGQRIAVTHRGRRHDVTVTGRPGPYSVKTSDNYTQSIDLCEPFEEVQQMQITTTRRRPKSFAWSYSKLKNYETCPKRHFHVDIQKDAKEEESENLQYGNMLHDALGKRLGEKRTPLPKSFAHMEEWCTRLDDGRGELHSEQKLAITKDFGPCAFFDNEAWFRGVADVVKIMGPVALVLDWKTGKVVEDSVQLALTAACVFAHFPQVQKIRCEFVWLKEDATSRADFARTDMPGFWASVLPRVQTLEQAHNTTTYPAKPGNLCRRWCPVKQCPHHGE
jgi:hypothetical protein